MNGLGARYQVVLSDMWGYPNGLHGWPYENWSAYEAFVRDTARANRDSPAVWDIWNEPDIPYFWAGTVDQWLETWRRAIAASGEAASFGPQPVSDDLRTPVNGSLVIPIGDLALDDLVLVTLTAPVREATGR